MSWMMFFYPRDDTLKMLCLYLYWKSLKKRWSRRGYLEDVEGFLIRDMEDRVILDVLEDVFLP